MPIPMTWPFEEGKILRVQSETRKKPRWEWNSKLIITTVTDQRVTGACFGLSCQWRRKLQMSYDCCFVCRLAALQAAGANDWRARVCRLSPEKEDPKAIERAKNRINVSTLYLISFVILLRMKLQYINWRIYKES